MLCVYLYFYFWALFLYLFLYLLRLIFVLKSEFEIYLMIFDIIILLYKCNLCTLEYHFSQLMKMDRDVACLFRKSPRWIIEIDRESQRRNDELN